MAADTIVILDIERIPQLLCIFQDVSGSFENLLSGQATGAVERVPQLSLTFPFLGRERSRHVDMVGLLEDNLGVKYCNLTTAGIDIRAIDIARTSYTLMLFPYLLHMGTPISLHLQHHHPFHHVSGGLGSLHLSLLGFSELNQKKN